MWMGDVVYVKVQIFLHYGFLGFRRFVLVFRDIDSRWERI